MKYTIGKLVGVIFVVFFTLCAANSVSAIGVTSTITVRQSPEGITYDAVKGEMFVANYGNNTVSVIADQQQYCGCNHTDAAKLQSIRDRVRPGRG